MTGWAIRFYFYQQGVFIAININAFNMQEVIAGFTFRPQPVF
jgi:hypothetical protein